MLALSVPAWAQTHSEAFKDNIYVTGELKPVDSVLKVKVGDMAPDFMLFSITGQKVTLSQYRGKKNVVISFVPAAWTPVCSDQWPGYNIVKDLFDKNDAVLLGITVDNIPTLFAWTNQMGKLWFPVLSDFYPHGKVAETLRGSAQRRHLRAGPLRHRQEGRDPLHRRPRHQQAPVARGTHPGTGKTEVMEGLQWGTPHVGYRESGNGGSV